MLQNVVKGSREDVHADKTVHADLSFSLSRVRLAVPIDVFPDFDVGRFSSFDGNGNVAQGTHRDLDILYKIIKEIKSHWRLYSSAIG